MKAKIILIVGASGVGKDSLLNASNEHFSNKINIIKRYITREADQNEDNVFLEKEEFENLREKNFFISSWQAHSHHYGISQDSIKEGINVISISRSKIIDFERRYTDVSCIHVFLRRDELEKRLRLRKRENEEAIQKRLNIIKPKIKAKNLIPFNNAEVFTKSSKKFIALLTSIIKD